MAGAGNPDAGLGGPGGFALVLSDRYLLLIAFLMLVLLPVLTWLTKHKHREGDLWILNDPYRGGTAGNHDERTFALYTPRPGIVSRFAVTPVGA